MNLIQNLKIEIFKSGSVDEYINLAVKLFTMNAILILAVWSILSSPPHYIRVIMDLWAFSTAYLSFVCFSVGIIVYLKRRYKISKEVQARLLSLLLFVLGIAAHQVSQPSYLPEYHVPIYTFLFSMVNGIFAVPLYFLESILGPYFSPSNAIALIIILAVTLIITWLWNYIIAKLAIYAEERFSIRWMVTFLLAMYLTLIIGAVILIDYYGMNVTF